MIHRMTLVAPLSLIWKSRTLKPQPKLAMSSNEQLRFLHAPCHELAPTFPCVTGCGHLYNVQLSHSIVSSAAPGFLRKSRSYPKLSPTSDTLTIKPNLFEGQTSRTAAKNQILRLFSGLVLNAKSALDQFLPSRT